MKKRMLSLLAALILFLACLSARAEGALPEGKAVEFDPLTVFTGLIGDTYFALPGMPVRVQDADYEGYWTDSWQLWGTCGKDGAEFQLRTADIGLWIAGYQEKYPENSPEDMEIQAVFSYAAMMLRLMGGSVSNPYVTKKDGIRIQGFDYTYEDSPGHQYTAVCLLDGSRAVCLLAECCEHTEQAQALLRPATEEQKAAFAERQPETVDFFGLSLTFPYAPQAVETEKASMALCFTADGTNIKADYVPVGLTMDGAGREEILLGMEKLAERASASVGGTGVLGGVLSGGGDSAWQYEFTTVVDYGYGEDFGQKWLGRGYAGEAGIWYVMAADTEAGRAFMDSATFGLQEALDDTGLLLDGLAAPAGERAEDDDPASLPQFAQAMADLIRSGACGSFLSIDDVRIGEALYSDDRWVRTLSLGFHELYALLLLSSQEEGAFVNVIHVIGSEKTDFEQFAAFAACCAAAAEGAEADFSALRADREKDFQWRGARYQAQDSFEERGGSFNYHLCTIQARAPKKMAGQPEDWDGSLTFADPSVTVRQFEARWEKLNQRLFSGAFSLAASEPMENDKGEIIHIFHFGENTFVLLTANGADADAPILKARACNLNEYPPQAYLGGLMALAALTDMPEDQFVYMTMMLEEYPLWQDLTGMWPVVGWRGKFLFLADDDMDGQLVPLALLVDTPKEADPTASGK